MDQIDAILYINLEHRTDRREHLEAEFKRMGIPAEKIHRINAIKNNKVDIGSSWQSTMNAVNATETLVRGVKPIEGTTGWVNNWMIASATKSINCSYKWIDWMISPQTNALTAEWFGEAPSNKEACTLTADKRHCALFNAQDEKFWSDIYYWEYPQTKCIDGRTEIQCVGYEDWFLTWTNFRNS